jgi:uncharacterized membrane protein YbhN (UPF0104 family)
MITLLRDKLGKMSLKKWAHRFGLVLSSLAFYYLFTTFSDLRLEELRHFADWRAWLIILTLFLIHSIFFALLILPYNWIIEALAPSVEIPLRQFSGIYLNTNLMKYLPGNLMEFVGRNLALRNFGVGHRVTAFASLLETILVTVNAVAVSSIFSVTELIKIFEMKWKFSLTIPATVLLILSIGTIGLLAGFLVKNKLDLRKRALVLIKVICKSQIVYCLFFLSSGLAISILSHYLENPGGSLLFSFGPHAILKMTSVYALSWVVGYVTPGLPGGLGVREATLVIALSTMMGRDVALSLAVILRIISLSCDVFLYLVSLGLLKTSKSNENSLA